MPSLSSHSKHEEFWSDLALQIKISEEIKIRKRKRKKKYMNQMSSSREQWEQKPMEQ